MAATPLMNRSDPFVLVSDSLLSSVETMNSSLGEWRLLLRSKDTATNAEFQTKERELRTGISDSLKKIRALRDVLGKVEANRAAHPDMTDAEVERRRKTVNDLESDINGIAKALESREAKDKRAKDRDRADRTRRDRAREAEAAATSASARGHADHMSQQQALQHREAAKQDEHLSRLEEGLDVAGQKAHLMRRELDEQDGLIDDMGKDMSTAQTGLEAATERMQKLLQTKDNRIICIIIVLIATLIALCIFAFS